MTPCVCAVFCLLIILIILNGIALYSPLFALVFFLRIEWANLKSALNKIKRAASEDATVVSLVGIRKKKNFGVGINLSITSSALCWYQRKKKLMQKINTHYWCQTKCSFWNRGQIFPFLDICHCSSSISTSEMSSDLQQWQKIRIEACLSKARILLKHWINKGTKRECGSN